MLSKIVHLTDFLLAIGKTLELVRKDKVVLLLSYLGRHTIIDEDYYNELLRKSIAYDEQQKDNEKEVKTDSLNELLKEIEDEQKLLKKKLKK